MPRHLFFVLVAVSWLCSSLSTAQAASYTFTTIDVPNSAFTAATGINQQGQIVGWYLEDTSGSTDNLHYFLYGNGLFTTFDVPGGAGTWLGLNNQGQIVGANFLYDEGVFTTLEFPGSVSTSIWGINDSSQIVGSYGSSDGRQHGFLYDGGVFTTIDVPGATKTSAQGINADAQIVGEYVDDNNVRHGFLYDGSVFTTIDMPETYGHADGYFGINASSQIVGRYFPANDYPLWHGFVYDEGAFTTIELPPALDTSVFGINDEGEIVGMFGDNYKSQGFVGTPSQELVALGPVTLWIGLKNSDDQGTAFDLQAEVAINSALVATARTLCIAGVTRNPDKATEAMILFGSFPPVSVPSDAALSLTIRTRIGTNPDGTQCSGHSNAVGLRLYYDAETRPSRLGMEITPDLPEDFFLHSDSSGDYLDATVPTASTARFKNSSALNFKNGNPWKAIGTWSLKPSQNIVYAGAE